LIYQTGGIAELRYKIFGSKFITSQLGNHLLRDVLTDLLNALFKNSMTTNLSFFLLFSLLLLSCNSGPKEIPLSLDAKTITHRGHSYDVVTIDDPQSIHFFWKDASNKCYKSLGNLKTALAAKNKKLTFAMNGGMYLKDGSPQGLYIEKNHQLAKTDTVQKAYGNFYLQPNGIFYIGDSTAQVLTTVDYLQGQTEAKYATQSGPMLVINGQLHTAFRETSTSTHFRNGVGVRADGKIVFAISNEQINFL